MTTWPGPRISLALVLAGVLAVFAFGALGTPNRPADVSGVTASLTGVTARVPAFKHIFVIVLENKSYEQVVDSAHASYLNTLAQQYGLATNYYAIRHPSLQN